MDDLYDISVNDLSDLSVDDLTYPTWEMFHAKDTHAHTDAPRPPQRKISLCPPIPNASALFFMKY